MCTSCSVKNNNMDIRFLRAVLLVVICYAAGSSVNAQTKEILTLTSTCPDNVRPGDTITLLLTVDVAAPWYVYAPGDASGAPGIQPMRLKLAKLPVGLKAVGQLEFSNPMPKGASLVYMGKGHTLTQRFVLDATASTGSITLQGELTYQACNDETCLPEMGETISKTLQVTGGGGASTIVTPVDQDWEALERSTNLFADAEASAGYETLAPLAMRRFEDAGYQRRANLALAFWKDYPHDSRHLQAMKLFLSADPWFVASRGNTLLEKEKTWKGLDSKAFMRSMVIDTLAKKQWLQQGEAMVASIFQAGDSSILAKETASFLLFARDYRLAARHFGLQEHVADEEAYWQPFYHRLVAHMTRYADQPNLAARATDFLAALKGRSPAVAASYWKGLLDLPEAQTGDSAGILALRQTALEQLEALGVAEGTAPVDMAFTALDGRAVDLEDLHGKVVLIDFWATWCKPCVEELPHLKTLYAQYRDLGFEIVGICLDDQSAKARVGQLLEKQGVTWPQRFEGAGFGSDAYRLLYGINALPTVWLLDKQGRVVDRDARGSRLEPLIREQLEITQ